MNPTEAHVIMYTTLTASKTLGFVVVYWSLAKGQPNAPMFILYEREVRQVSSFRKVCLTQFKAVCLNIDFV